MIYSCFLYSDRYLRRGLAAAFSLHKLHGDVGFPAYGRQSIMGMLKYILSRIKNFDK